MPHEFDRFDHGQPYFQAGQVDLFERRRNEPQCRRQGHSPQQRLEPFVVPFDQNLIHVNALKRGREPDWG